MTRMMMTTKTSRRRMLEKTRKLFHWLGQHLIGITRIDIIAVMVVVVL